MKLTYEEIYDIVSELMRKYGPDGHADGSDIIAKFIYLYSNENSVKLQDFIKKYVENHADFY